MLTSWRKKRTQNRKAPRKISSMLYIAIIFLSTQLSFCVTLSLWYWCLHLAVISPMFKVSICEHNCLVSALLLPSMHARAHTYTGWVKGHRDGGGAGGHGRVYKIHTCTCVRTHTHHCFFKRARANSTPTGVTPRQQSKRSTARRLLITSRETDTFCRAKWTIEYAQLLWLRSMGMDLI